ncbi:unnamed protein product [Ceutorhynchus assimilis]|uniref:Endonuclease/exonuclease/phosphatase domain-containing protein n=1 Tax=Ceutorhynchus assimilis TaxID=467358 RepID=A0A9N9MRR2_9CUCU|nr:unnamed protein product [Ceutorhynchus assimilis]
MYSFSDTTTTKPRACVYVPRNIKTTFLPQLSTPDLAVVMTTCEMKDGAMDIVIASSYLPVDTPMPELTIALVENCRRHGRQLIIGEDTNAYHNVWGSEDNNTRGDKLVEFLISTQAANRHLSRAAAKRGYILPWQVGN